MIAYRTGTNGNAVKIENSLGQRIWSGDIYRLLDFLSQPSDDLRVFWNLDDALAPLFRLMPRHMLMDFFKRGDAYFSPYHLKYYSAKKGNVGMLQVYRGERRAFYYHLSQFYPDEPDIDDLDGVVSKGAELLGELDSIGICPTSLSSHASLLTPALAQLPLPNYSYLPPEVEELAYLAGGMPWIEAHQVGHWQEPVFDYDLSQAYASVAAMLIDCRPKYGQWVRGKSRPSGAMLGFSAGQITVNSNVSPFAVRVGPENDQKTIHAKGTWPMVITLAGLDLLHDYPELGRFAPSEDSVWFVPDRVIRPLQNFVYRMHQSRGLSPLLDRVIKRALNASVYGRFCQFYTDYIGGEPVRKLGRNSIFTWATTIEASVSMAVMDFLLKHDMVDSLIHVGTDGCLTTKRVDLPNNDRKPGTWRLDAEGPALVLGPGSLWYGNKHPQQLYYGDVVRLIKARPSATEWATKVTRRMTLGDVTHDIELDDIGRELPVITTVYLDSDNLGRNFNTFPHDGRELLSGQYRSEPIDARYLLRQAANNEGGFKP